MKITVSIIALFLLGLICMSCQKTKDKKYHDLTIILDSTFDYELIDSTTLLGNNYKSSMEWSYDTIKHNCYYHWDSLTSNNYIFKVQTIFSKVKDFNLSFPNDTNFLLDNELGFVTTMLIDKNELYQSDTIELVFTSSGCFHQYYEKLIITKNNNEYTLKTESEQIKKVPSAIIDSLFQMQFDSKKELDKIEKNGFQSFSTTTNGFYLLANNKLFKFNDRGIEDWDLYENFKAKFITNN